jgi:hypothetical protein
MCSQCARLLRVMLVSYGLAGCGTVVPNIKEAWDKDYPGDEATNTPPLMGAAQIEFEIKKRVYCDLKDAVRTANSYAVTETKGKEVVNTSSLIPGDWGAHISLSLQVDETSGLNPGVALNTPRPSAITSFPGLAAVTTPQTFSLGLGGTLSSSATRIDKFDPYYSIAYLMKPITPNGVCNKEHPDPFVQIGWTPAKSSPLIESDLGITEWLVGAMFTNRSIPSFQPPPAPPTRKELEQERERLHKEGYKDAEIVQILASKAGGSQGGGQGTKPDTVSIEIKFIIVSNGNVTPTWKLVRVSANAGATPLVNVGRTRTHDLIITIGPPTQTTANTHLASQIGQSVGAANRAILAAAPAINNTFTFPFP